MGFDNKNSGISSIRDKASLLNGTQQTVQNMTKKTILPISQKKCSFYLDMQM